jgi:hypothetical protein
MTLAPTTVAIASKSTSRMELGPPYGSVPPQGMQPHRLLDRSPARTAQPFPQRGPELSSASPATAALLLPELELPSVPVVAPRPELVPALVRASRWRLRSRSPSGGRNCLRLRQRWNRRGLGLRAERPLLKH